MDLLGNDAFSTCAFSFLRTTWARLVTSTLLIAMWHFFVKIRSEKQSRRPKNVNVDIKIYFNPPFQESLLSKCRHLNLRVSSLIIPAPSCLLRPALLLSVWVCLCMRHPLLNYRYSEWTFKGMTQACTLVAHHYISTEGEGVFSKQANHMVMWRSGRLRRKRIKSTTYEWHIQRHVTAGALSPSVKIQCTAIVRSCYWFPALSKLVFPCFHGYNQWLRKEA